MILTQIERDVDLAPGGPLAWQHLFYPKQQGEKETPVSTFRTMADVQHRWELEEGGQ